MQIIGAASIKFQFALISIKTISFFFSQKKCSIGVKLIDGTDIISQRR